MFSVRTGLSLKISLWNFLACNSTNKEKHQQCSSKPLLWHICDICWMGVPSVSKVLIDSWVITVLMRPVMYRSRLRIFFSLKLYLSQMMHLQNHYPVLSCTFGLKILIWSCHFLVGPECPRDLKCLSVPLQCYLELQRGCSSVLYQLSPVCMPGWAVLRALWTCGQVLASIQRGDAIYAAHKAGAGRASLFSVFSAPKTPPSSGTKQATPLHLTPCLVLCLDSSDSLNTLSWHENGYIISDDILQRKNNQIQARSWHSLWFNFQVHVTLQCFYRYWFALLQYHWYGDFFVP